MSKLSKGRRFLIIFSTILMIVYFIWRIFFTFPTEYGKLAMVCAIILLFCELVSAIEAFVRVITSINPTVPEKPDIPDEWYPDVDVFIATHNESTEILYRTINGCKHMEYPDKSKVHIWVCDDGYRSEVKELCDKLGVGWQGLMNNKDAKAGNLNNALSKTKAPLIVTLDADMIPMRTFLLETVPYFYLPKLKKTDAGEWVERTEDELDPDYKIGFIQTPQNFYNPDLFQYNLYSEDKVPNEQDYFFRDINITRNKANAAIYAGSNTVISREALEKVGGIATGTITEDFETGIHIQGCGYTCYAISTVVAHGLAPDSIDSLIKQRERWGRGCVYSLRRLHIWTNKELKLPAKFSYYACKTYWWTFFRRFVFILCPIIFSVFSIPVMVCKPWELLLIWLPSYVLFTHAQKVSSRDIRTNRWSSIIDTVMFPYLIIPIFLESIGIEQHNFYVTRKDRVIDEKTDRRLAVPHGILLIFSIFALISSVHDLMVYKAFGSIIIIYWLGVNIFSLLMSIFFMIGRKNYRMSDRYDVEIPVKVEVDGKEYYGESINISESGMAVKFDTNLYITDKPVKVTVKTNEYSAEVYAKEVYVSDYDDLETNKKMYKFSFFIVEMDDKNKSEYYQIIYDREPSLPSYTVKSDSIFANLADNLGGRITGVTQQKRRLYRVDVNQEIATADGSTIYMYDYSYRYIVLGKDKANDKKTVDLILDKEVTASCNYVRDIDEKKAMYEISNGKELFFNPKFVDIVASWEKNKR